MQQCIFFLGAGASVPSGMSTMTDMVHNFEKRTKEPSYGLGYVVEDIKNRLRDYRTFDIEALIAVLQDIISYDTSGDRIFSHPSLHMFTYGGYRTFIDNVQTLGKQYQNEATQLLRDVKNFIAESCTIKEIPFKLYEELFHWGLVRYGFNYGQAFENIGEKSIENHIFTTNYDLVLEAYCSHMNLAYYNGQKPSGLLELGLKNSALYSLNSVFHKIYKLHGSITWYSDENDDMRWITEPVKTGITTALGHKVASELLVYPAFAKYTFREPFYQMFHYLKTCLVECKMCYVVGYSFRDDDILGLFHDAMMINEDLRLTIIDPMAETIVKDKFPRYEHRIKRIPYKFGETAIQSLQDAD